MGELGSHLRGNLDPRGLTLDGRLGVARLYAQQATPFRNNDGHVAQRTPGVSPGARNAIEVTSVSKRGGLVRHSRLTRGSIGEHLMAVNTTMVVYADGSPADVLRSYPVLDKPATRGLV